MTDLQEIYRAVDHLTDEEKEQLRAYLDHQIVPPQIMEDPKTRAAALMAAFAEMREGLSQEELDAIVEDMNSEYVEPLDPDEFAWLDEPEGTDD